jgi:nickel-dependent lactate racemase
LAAAENNCRIHLAFGREGLDVDLPGGFEYRILECPPTVALADPVDSIVSALRAPAAGSPLADLAQGKKSAAISVCDITRPAPNPVVLPPLLRALHSAGIPRSGTRILIATGLHRAATEAEIRQITGPEVYGRVEVLNHDARNTAQHRNIGTTKSGTPVWIDQRFLDADLHITLGFIEPHLMLGFSGGRKLVAPGLAGEATIKELHSSRFMRDERTCEASISDNPLHEELLEIARMARQDFIIDTTLTRDRRISGVFAGEPVGAHRAGVEWVRAKTMQTLDGYADAVITTSAGYPLDLTFYQTVKGVTAASHLVKPGGKILLFGACQEGAGAPEFREMLLRYRTADDFMRAIEGQPVSIDQWQLEKLALAARKAKILYCLPGLPQEYRAQLWGPAFEHPEEALRAFFQGLRAGHRVAVIPEGPYVLAQVASAAISTREEAVETFHR